MTKRKTERTSKKVAHQAALLLNSRIVEEIVADLDDMKVRISFVQNRLSALQRNIKSVAGSSLTQREK